MYLSAVIFVGCLVFGRCKYDMRERDREGGYGRTFGAAKAAMARERTRTTEVSLRLNIVEIRGCRKDRTTRVFILSLCGCTYRVSGEKFLSRVPHSCFIAKIYHAVVAQRSTCAQGWWWWRRVSASYSC